MGTTYGLAVMALMLILFVIALRWRKKIIRDTLAEFAEKPYSYTLVIHGEGENAVADKIIVNAGEDLSSFSAEDFESGQFCVQVKDGGETFARKVAKAYPCDIDGNAVEQEEADGEEPLSDASSGAAQDALLGATHRAAHLALELETTGESFEKPFAKQSDSAEECRNKSPYEYSVSHKKFSQSITLCNDWWWQTE